MGAQALSLIKGYALTKLKQRLGLNTELKYVDVNGTTTATTTLTSRIATPTIPQGSAVGQRNGAGVRCVKIDQRICIEAAAAATKGCQIRVITVRHKSAAGANVADILQVTTDISSPLHNNLAANHIELISDQTYTLGHATAPNSTILIENTFSRPNWQMEWTDADTAGTPANYINGAIATYWMQDQVSTAPVYTSTNRYWFVDN